MVEYKKNCSENDYESQINSSQSYAEYLYSNRIFKKAELSYNNNYEKESIDDYFTSLQLISNAILLKKFKIRAKKSVCAYFKLYQEKIITEKDYEILENIREKRNLVHYDGYESSFLDDDEVLKIVEKSKILYNNLKEIYEVK